ncbi:N-(5'-phosphoribosyl)anthranilate isomerase [Xanthocytophaga flava]|uniref:N-(5'-phosphoribosyl)anthranilate isomerase n=1 Tax=Xanthocytophaga flava TaxID=3048013 RepID=UPI0028D763A9|nr:N-(5'-phosphoribosyl)anthranilate isomerase [Xanthocytophaga flavus]MDJ1467880.1 N-(5'-phosphoribosyl)anthranilate isomerase [Xanthocytophaga flavus]
MSLQTFVKISAVTNLSDARYCAGMGVDMLGFSLDPSAETFVDPITFQSITEWVAGVQLIGEVESIEPDALQELVKNYPIDGLQIGNSSDWKGLQATGLTLLCKISWTEDLSLQNFQTKYDSIKPYVSYFLIESEEDSITPEIGYHLTQIAEHYPIILGFGIQQNSILQTLSSIPFKGIALKGGQEIRPGYKDFDDLAEILEVLETE